MPRVLASVEGVDYVFACRRERHDPCGPCSTPPRITLASEDKHSPLVAVLQYYSSLAAGRCSRLVLLYKPAGCANFSDWVNKYPKDAHVLRRAVGCASSQVWRRHTNVFSDWPFLLAALAKGTSLRMTIAGKFMDAHLCCLD